MKRLLTAIVAAGSILAVSIAPAAAITKNFQQDFEHTFVGLIAFYNADGVFQHRCTGELLAPTVVLTAGHCTDNGTGGVNASRARERTLTRSPSTIRSRAIRMSA